MIYTSYFAVYRKLPKTIVPVAISRGVPTWFEGEYYPDLAPLWDTIMKYKNGGSWEAYKEEYYRTVLNNLSQNDVYNNIMELTGGRDAAFLCYEASKNNCHRHICRDWLNSAGIECREYIF